MILHGNAVSPGMASGIVYIYRPFHVDVKEAFCAPEEAESHLARYEEAKKTAARELERVAAALANDSEKAKIFTAHKDILDDVAINEEIHNGILQNRWDGAWAISKVYAQFIKMMKRVSDPLIRERYADFADVQKRLLRIWFNGEEQDLGALEDPVILATHDLFPSDTASLNRGKVLAILTEAGGTASHSAIIARSYEIPAIVGIANLLELLRPGMTAAVDALTGEVHTDPDKTFLDTFGEKRREFLRKRMETKTYLGKEPLTADGQRIDIGLNIGNAGEEELAGEAYTDFVGLFRTEFLYMGKDSLPDEEEQFTVYKEVLERYGKRPVTLRTLDIGGDKTLDYMELPKEDNPFLGNRALRFCFSRPDIFKTQIRAALRASVYGNLWLMLPMVGSIENIREAKQIIGEVQSELKEKGISYNSDMKIGIMIEIPSIAIMAKEAAAEVDFASIGTNDLCQYLCAVDRMNPEVSRYYQNFHPALFRLIGSAVQGFAEKPICVCGELGGNPPAAAVLVGLGMRKLSMGLASVAPVKRMLSTLSLAKAKELAETALAFSTAKEVESYLKDQLEQLK
ncbi:MAG: phosphoenolpyruvate--protein phosphotransferase [Treponema sp.]|jgi:phosphotransferase system enzyme I (PtsI)|nr:phosphoenolpyruvate--protein phosphotransferase [Treponema sp.]